LFESGQEAGVMFVQLIAAMSLAVTTQPSPDTGRIAGRVINRSRSNAAAPATEVVLELFQEDQFSPIATTISDERGEFIFDNLPIDETRVFRVGAKQDGVYYPGERLRLTPQQATCLVTPFVYDSMLGPSPLVAQRYEIVIRPEPGLLNVTETMLIANQSSTCYVGQAANDKGSVTLRLGIPSTFEKVTFDKEFYGRRFVVIDRKLVTTIPWPPGERVLKFTYILPIEKQCQVWERPLDLPCSDVCVRVVTEKPNEISCNLGPEVNHDDDVASFISRVTPLATGHVIRVQLGSLPVPFAIYGRWVALGLLISIIVVVSLLMMLRRVAKRRNAHPAIVASSAREPRGPHKRMRIEVKG